jgi:hypothetical protein
MPKPERCPLHELDEPVDAAKQLTVVERGRLKPLAAPELGPTDVLARTAGKRPLVAD